MFCAWKLQMTNQRIPAKGIDIQLNVKRYFGTLRVGDPKTTNGQGICNRSTSLQTFPVVDLVSLIFRQGSKMKPGYLYSNQANASLAIGKPFLLKSLTHAHAMWSVRSKAPLWLVLTFSLSLIAVWGFIFYILISLKKLKQTM